MEEIQDIHTEKLEWGCVMVLINKISTIEDNIDGHWDELLDMIANVLNDEKDSADIFFTVYAFFFRLYYRLRANHMKRPFNQISKVDVAGKELYRITNYDYKTFKWARKEGLVDGISNDYIDLPVDKLTINQQRAFARRIGENYA